MIFFRNKSKRNKKQAEPKIKTQTEQTGKWFFKEIVHERINQKPLEWKKKKTDTLTLKKKTHAERE